jgi:tRNA threonylcarbamoyladenosine biosynthesis protein TsaB
MLPESKKPGAVKEPQADQLLLGIDTCGPSGSVALVRLSQSRIEVLGRHELAGRSYSATLVAAVGELLSGAQTPLDLVRAIVVTNGPGSFTGVRVGLSAVKGLAEPAQIPVVAISRLAVLAHKAGIPNAALDAHRHELYLRVERPGGHSREFLAGASELAAITPTPLQIAVCDPQAGALLASAWPEAELVHTGPPTAADAIELALPRIRALAFDDLALLDGHYLRRSDAEIFAPAAAAPGNPR